MSEIAATTVHEAYAFACMRCGYGWEQAYEIEHHVDGSGRPYVVYRANGERVPSPLSTPTCANCEGHVVRIMRAGRVSLAQQLLPPRRAARKAAAREAAARKAAAREAAERQAAEREAAERQAAGEAGRSPAALAPAGGAARPHHRQLSGLLRPFHRR
ncbi:hypothetical protein CP967_20335 [Streptomyces nitrosporeus]|uniref:C2H2-type domain-containing protein n=1 Tax=Streptomyces nitrosporeus TaxID=28894 RepID=A0A5J6FGB7_9ACTN|nr:hypothetical protein [Streptomyces nitrosporeus]QEU74030.1 hypothetical protein CP967_20335 [Streptomyces nitrosporeus]GGZ00366.1 hypothetical protein GCM10010327_33520 [Streptomyces nitrosporeus]